MVKIEEVNGEELVKKFAEEMEEMLGRKMKSVKVGTSNPTRSNGWNLAFRSSFQRGPCCLSSQRLAEAAEDADLYHEYNDTMEVCDSRPSPSYLYLLYIELNLNESH